MKRVINGRRYDTDKATLVCEHISGEPMEAGYTRETLYRKRGGEHFIVVQGTYTFDIVPLTYKEAQAWAIANMGGAAYTEEFQAQGMKTINVTLSLDCKRMLDRIANDVRVSRGKVVEDLVRAHYAKMFPGD